MVGWRAARSHTPHGRWVYKLTKVLLLNMWDHVLRSHWLPNSRIVCPHLLYFPPLEGGGHRMGLRHGSPTNAPLQAFRKLDYKLILHWTGSWEWRFTFTLDCHFLKIGGGSTQPIILGANKNASSGLTLLISIVWSFCQVVIFEVGCH